MNKLAAVLGLLFFVTTWAGPVLLSDEDKQAKLNNVVLPSLVDDEVLKSVNPYSCLDEYIYDSISELLKVKEERDYLCAFIAYQANKDLDSGVGYYESKSEADMRYECFKQSVDEVNEVNSQNLSWIAGINFFSDMNPYDRSWYTGFGYYYDREAIPRNCVDPVPEKPRVIIPEDSDEFVVGAPGGFGVGGFGAPGGFGK